MCLALGALPQTEITVPVEKESKVVNVIATQPEIAPPETLVDQRELLKKILVDQ